MKVHYTKVLVGTFRATYNIFQKYGKFFYMQDFVEKVLVGTFRATIPQYFPEVWQVFLHTGFC